jgi:hypothetical protein
MAKSDWFASIYRACKGWTAVLYGPEGPMYTGYFGSDSIYDALKEALYIAESENVQIDVHGLVICPVCNGMMLTTQVCDCGYKPQYVIDFEAKLAVLQERFCQ